MPLLPEAQFHIYRDDLNHATISGNKLHKLTPNLQRALANQCDTVLSFGGPYSNHLHALAWACREAKLKCVGVVRGELHAQLTPTLKDCQDWGMTLLALPRKAYRNYQKQCADRPTRCLASDFQFPELMRELPAPSTTFVIPEGGSNKEAISSLANAYRPLFGYPEYSQVTHAVCATGTGATLAGLRLAAPPQVKVIGIQAVAEGDATRERVNHWLHEFANTANRLQIIPGHLGGFAKAPAALTEFIEQFKRERAIPLDKVYNAKVMFQLAKLHAEGYFSAIDQVLIIHTGGLQGQRSV